MIMTSYYTVATENKFGLLEDEQSDDETTNRVMTREAHEKIAIQEGRDLPGARPGQTTAPGKEQGQRDSAPVRGRDGQSRGGRGGAAAGNWGQSGNDEAVDRGYKRGGDRQERGDRESYRGGRGGGGGYRGGMNRGEDDFLDKSGAPKERHRDNRGGGGYGEGGAQSSRGGRGGRGTGPPGGAPGGGGGRPRREFDRHSGTGRNPGMKKGGAGGHNWGSEAAEQPAAEQPTVAGADWDAISPKGDWPGERPAEGETTEPVQTGEDTEGGRRRKDWDKEKVPEEPPVFNLDHFKQEQMKARASLPTRDSAAHDHILTSEELEKEGFIVREPTERDALDKEAKRGEAYTEEEVEVKHKRGGLTMNYYEFAAKNGNNLFRRGRGGRGRGGDRGGATGRGDQGRHEAIRPVQQMIELDDASQFPALA